MIRRNSSKINSSIINDANTEHLTAVKGILSDAPFTELNGVSKSNNFELDNDGSLVLRKPLMLLTTLISKNDVYLYDKIHLLTITSNFNMYITGETTYVLRYYNRYLEKYDNINFDSTDALTFISSIINHFNLQDSTYLAVTLRDNDALSDFKISSGGTSRQKMTYEDNSTDLYRFIKVYYDTDINKFIFEIVYPELNTFTSSTNTNAESLETNLLLDNPYAIRDLYNYGYNSVTKILAYWSSSVVTESNTTVAQLTEVNSNNFKLIVSGNSTINNVILKAFLTISDQNSRYYCCWERSTNGIDWAVAPEFLQKFQNNTNNPLVDRLVSDLTNEDFEKTAYKESLTEAASYLVTKKMVNFPISTNSADDTLDIRPDVLCISQFDAGYKYRFQVYLDTGKSVDSTNETIITTVAKSFFTELALGDTSIVPENLDTTGIFKYYTLTNSSTTSPSLRTLNGNILLNGCIDDPEAPDPGRGNALIIRMSDEFYNKGYKVKNITISLGNSFIEDSQTKALGGYVGFSSSTSESYSQSYDFINENQSKTYEIDNTVSIKKFFTIVNNINYTSVSTSDYYKYILSIQKIQIQYEYKDTVKTTTIYLGSTSGSYQINLSKDVILAPSLNTYRYALFNSKIFEYKNQIIAYGYNNIAISNVDSNIFKLSKVITFATTVTKVLNWRDYIIIFTTKDTTLAKYDYESDSYSLKLISTNIGLSEADADTAVTILNSIYFKSGYKFYKIVPNLYAANDDILNVHIISDSIDKLIDDTLINRYETHNISINNVDKYVTFIPLDNSRTLVFTYKLENKTWTLATYPIFVTELINLGLNNILLRALEKIYVFDKDLTTILKDTLVSDVLNLGCAYEVEVIDDDTEETSNVLTLFRLGFIEEIPYTQNAITVSNTSPISQINSDSIVSELSNIYETNNIITIDPISNQIIVNQDFITEHETVLDQNSSISEALALTNVHSAIQNVSSNYSTNIELLNHYESFNTGTNAARPTTTSINSSGISNISHQYSNTIVRRNGITTPATSSQPTYVTILGTEITNYIKVEEMINYIPYMDSLNNTIDSIYHLIKDGSCNDKSYSEIITILGLVPISFEIDFGQKSSNYTVYKSFLETKFTFVNLQEKVTFPMTVDIEIDGEDLTSKRIHIDANTDSPLWKRNLDDKGTLNTTFDLTEQTNYNNIVKQLIVKYAGKGKTIRHRITGNSITRFKFYSLDSKARLSVNKQ